MSNKCNKGLYITEEYFNEIKERFWQICAERDDKMHYYNMKMEPFDWVRDKEEYFYIPEWKARLIKKILEK